MKHDYGAAQVCMNMAWYTHVGNKILKYCSSASALWCHCYHFRNSSKGDLKLHHNITFYLFIAFHSAGLLNQEWPKLWEHLTDLKISNFLAFKTWFDFIMFMEYADGVCEHHKYQVKWVKVFLSTLKSLWMGNRRADLPKLLPPNLRDGAVVWTLRGTVRHWQGSSRFLLPELIPAILAYFHKGMKSPKLQKLSTPPPPPPPYLWYSNSREVFTCPHNRLSCHAG